MAANTTSKCPATVGAAEAFNKDNDAVGKQPYLSALSALSAGIVTTP